MNGGFKRLGSLRHRIPGSLRNARLVLGRRRWTRNLLLVATAGVAVSTLYSLEEQRAVRIVESVGLGVSAVKRCFLTLGISFIVGLDYAMLFQRYSDYTTDEYKQARSVVHSRTAKWMLWLCRKQTGIYIKVKQAFDSMEAHCDLLFINRLVSMSHRLSSLFQSNSRKHSKCCKTRRHSDHLQP